MKVYLIGSLRNPRIPEIANALEAACPGVSVFDEWFSGGARADEEWREHQIARGRSYIDAVRGPAAKNVFNFDKRHIDESDVGILVYPAGRSGHLELGYMAGRGKRTAILLDDQDRWDVMLQFADLVTTSVDELAAWLKTPPAPSIPEPRRVPIPGDNIVTDQGLAFEVDNVEVTGLSHGEYPQLWIHVDVVRLCARLDLPRNVARLRLTSEEWLDLQEIGNATTFADYETIEASADMAVRQRDRLQSKVAELEDALARMTADRDQYLESTRYLAGTADAIANFIDQWEKRSDRDPVWGSSKYAIGLLAEMIRAGRWRHPV